MLTIIAGMVVGKVQIQRNASSAQACILSSSMHPQLKHASSARACILSSSRLWSQCCACCDLQNEVAIRAVQIAKKPRPQMEQSTVLGRCDIAIRVNTPVAATEEMKA